MEPMALGSAPSSPSAGTSFLPGFLMGDPQPAPLMATSPGRNRNNSGNFGKAVISTPEPKGLRQKLFNQSIQESPNIQSPFVPLSEKSGPPKQGLFDTLGNTKKTPIVNSTTNHGYQPIFNESISKIGDDSFNATFGANENSVRFQTPSRIDRIDSNWVTVFGFPPSAMSIILSQLSSCGTILEKILPVQGNWVHLKFSNPNEVSRALTLNGRCITSNIMIGVTIYLHKENKENINSSAITSPVHARSLRQSFTSPHNMNNTVVTSYNVPQKSTDRKSVV